MKWLLGGLGLGSLVNQPGEVKMLYCNQCTEHTKHVTQSWVEFMSKKNSTDSQRLLLGAMGVLSDINPGMKLVAGDPAICTICGSRRSTKLNPDMETEVPSPPEDEEASGRE